MVASIPIFNPAAPAPNAARLSRLALDGLHGKVVGFVDNAKPNFNHLADDLGELLRKKYGVASVVKHRKRGQVPAGDPAMNALAEQCDAVIAGSGD